MLTEQNKEDILAMYRDGDSIEEIIEEYEGLNSEDIRKLCNEEDHSWDAE